MNKFACAVLLGCLAVAPVHALAPAAGVVDRVIAVVNRQPVTWSDLDERMRFEALQNRRPLSSLTGADRHSAFEHLVQARLLSEQTQAFTPVRSEETAAQLAELRVSWQMEKDDAGWNAVLASYGLSEDRLRDLMTSQLQVLQFVEFRVRPMVRVSRDEVEEYYTQRLLPQLIAQGAKPEPLETVNGQIRRLLTEKKLNDETDKFLTSLRAQTPVEILWDAVK
ncbi:MAG: hypothetical protein P4M01_10865 [Acidobacteriota bacterium]|nr:hypothetical protein [Acidobacteriota bacterium]